MSNRLAVALLAAGFLIVRERRIISTTSAYGMYPRYSTEGYRDHSIGKSSKV